MAEYSPEMLEMIVQRTKYDEWRGEKFDQERTIPEDAQMRMILSLRYVNGLSWQQVAFHMGQEGDGSTQRKQHDAFLRKVSLNS